MLEFQNKKIAIRILWLLGLGLCLIPLFFINVTDSLDWGDDNIQFIYQSKHIGKIDNNYKIVINSNDHAPVKRGLLLSFLLSVNKSENILNYKYILTSSLVLSSFILFFFFLQFHKVWESFLATLCFAYNYRLVGLKDEICAEFLFVIILYLIFILFAQKSKSRIIFSAFLFALLFQVRAVGIVFYLPFLATILFTEELRTFNKIKSVVYSVAITTISFICLQWLLAPKFENQESTFYTSSFLSNFEWRNVPENINTYKTYFLFCFEQELPSWTNIILKILASVFFIVGLLDFFCKRNIFFLQSSFVIYVLLLLIWHDHSTPTRYLLPIFPFILLLILQGINRIFTYANIRFELATCSILFIFLISNFHTIWINGKRPVALGPSSAELQADFSKIKELTSTDDVIAFYKPVVINYKCDRNSFSLKAKTFNTALEKANYFLIPKTKELPEFFEMNSKILPVYGDTISLAYFYLIKNPI